MSFRLNLVLTSNLPSCVVKLTSLSSDVNCSSSWENPNNKTLVSKPADPCCTVPGCAGDLRSEEHTSELQSLRHLVCRLLLEKKKSTRLNSSHLGISYAVFCLKKKTLLSA